MKIAIVTVAYNRTDSLGRLLTSLEKASYNGEDVTLIISIDKSNTDAVENFADNYKWSHGKKRVIKHEKNLGLRPHMLSLAQHFDEFDALVVLEDDVTVASSFMNYVKACVEKYYNCEKIAGISLYSFGMNNYLQRPFTPTPSQYDIYLMNIAQSWGQVWMKKQWLAFREWYDTHNEEFNLPHLPADLNHWPAKSWLKYHTRYCIEENKYFVYPYRALSTNNFEPGENVNSSDTIYQSVMQALPKTEYLLPTIEECEVKYDGFFEPKFLGKYLGISDSELCVDFYGYKPTAVYKRYVLTIRSLPYKVIRSFALQYKPIEMNIISQLEGNEIKLYDTTVSATAPKDIDRHLIYNYLYPKGFYNSLFILGIGRISRLIIDLFKIKLRQR